MKELLLFTLFLVLISSFTGPNKPSKKKIHNMYVGKLEKSHLNSKDTIKFLRERLKIHLPIAINCNANH